MPDGSTKAIMNLLPDESSAELGLRFQVFPERLGAYCGVGPDKISGILPEQREPYAYYPGAPSDLRGLAGFFSNDREAERFLSALSAMPGIKAQTEKKSGLTPGQKSSQTKKAKALVRQ